MDIKYIYLCIDLLCVMKAQTKENVERNLVTTWLIRLTFFNNIANHYFKWVTGWVLQLKSLHQRNKLTPWNNVVKLSYF